MSCIGYKGTVCLNFLIYESLSQYIVGLGSYLYKIKQDILSWRVDVRYIVDISPDILDVIQVQIRKGEYRTVQNFITTAIHNQIYLIEHPENLYESDSQTKSQEVVISKKNDEINILDLQEMNIETVAHNPNFLYSMLSGFWNKFFPVKITVRVLANLMNENEGPVLVDALQETASKEARKIGLLLVRKEKGSGRKRGDRLFTGLPVKRNSESSRSRFKSHFVGALKTTKIDGMPGTLRLLDIKKRDDGKDYVSLTHTGLEFSKLQNPIIDLEDYSSILSDEEKDFLINLIQDQLPDEYNDIKYILNLIDQGKTDTKELLESVSTYKQGFSQNQISTFLSGMLNRLSDLDLVARRYDGLSYIYEVSQKGKKIIKVNIGRE